MEKASGNPEKIPYPFTKPYIFGAGYGEDPTVEFVNERANVRKTIVDKTGWFVGFPGIEKGDWVSALKSESCLDKKIQYKTSFERMGLNRFIVIWEVQPDGMYWMDKSGFGMTDDEEVRLYTFIDEYGDFMGPFRIYNVGVKRYFQQEMASNDGVCD